MAFLARKRALICGIAAIGMAVVVAAPAASARTHHSSRHHHSPSYSYGVPNLTSGGVSIEGALASGVVGQKYTGTLTASGGWGPPYTWSIAGGSPPPGVSMSSGVFSGMPTKEGASAFQIKVTDALGDVGVVDVQIWIGV